MLFKSTTFVSYLNTVFVIMLFFAIDIQAAETGHRVYEIISKKEPYNAKCNHWTNSFINFGELIELEDGSKWSVAKTDIYKISFWQIHDHVIITPNRNWFSFHKYCLANQTRESIVEASFNHGPIPFGPHTHWVVALDKYGGHVFLEDGSSWKVSHEDWQFFDKWLINDFVILGYNDSWFSPYAYILINVNQEHHVLVNPF